MASLHLVKIALPKDKQKLVKEFIMSRYVPRKTLNTSRGTYSIKHVAEKELKFYIPVNDFNYLINELGIPNKVIDNNMYLYAKTIS